LRERTMRPRDVGPCVALLVSHPEGGLNLVVSVLPRINSHIPRKIPKISTFLFNNFPLASPSVPKSPRQTESGGTSCVPSSSLPYLLRTARRGIPFTSSDGQAFVRLDESCSGGFYIILPVRSAAFRHWLTYEFFAEYDSLPTPPTPSITSKPGRTTPSTIKASPSGVASVPAAPTTFASSICLRNAVPHSPKTPVRRVRHCLNPLNRKIFL
jgi:hypothetical protein